MRHALRSVIDRAAAASGLIPLLERRARRTLAILTYHRVLPEEACRDYALPSLAMPLPLFRSHVEWLAPRSRLVGVAEGLRLIEAGEDRPIVAISFDDGYADNAILAAPVLDEVGARATFFIVAGLVGTPKELWFDVAARRYRARSAREREALGLPGSLGAWMAELKRLRPAERDERIDRVPEVTRARDPLDRIVTREELGELAAKGHEIGSHSWSHPIMPTLDDHELSSEANESRARLAWAAGRDVGGFCFPNGDHDDRVVRAVMDAGYTYAVTTMPGLNAPGADPFRLRRVDMNPSRFTGDPILSLRAELSQWREVLR